MTYSNLSYWYIRSWLEANDYSLTANYGGYKYHGRKRYTLTDRLTGEVIHSNISLAQLGNVISSFEKK